VTFPAFKAGDSVLRGSNGGFDFHTLPPSPVDSIAFAARQSEKEATRPGVLDSNWTQIHRLHPFSETVFDGHTCSSLSGMNPLDGTNYLDTASAFIRAFLASPSRERERGSGGRCSQVDSGPGSHLQSWQRYKRHRLFLIFLLLCWIPIIRIASLLQTHLHLPSLFAVVFAILWLALIFVEGWHVALWPCPTCGRCFVVLP
jgi:hypothetical protein